MPGPPLSPLTLSRRRLGQCVAAWAGASALGLPPSPASAAAASRTGDLVGEITYHLAGGRQNLLDLARERNLGVPEISAVNPGVDPWVPADETLITLPSQFILPDAPREGIVVNYGELRLFHFPKGGPVQTYAIGIGRDGFELKMGQTKIVRKKEKPTWYPTESTLRDKPWVGKMVPPGPDNPLGDYAMYLGWPTYLIHGTNLPYGVGRRVSRGCIRMYPEGVARLYPQVAPGTRVTAVDQRVKVGWHAGELYLEAQPDMAQLDELEATQTMTPRAPAPGDRQRIVDRAGPDAARIDWAVVEAELVTRRGVPVQITRPRPVVADQYGAPSANPAPGGNEGLSPPVIVRRGVGGGGLY
ncbi:MAG TPA: L,D-transpeptidase family protein [Geminicoccaceae bacterium]|nr:L,D-transpeptidase family protein [Geminicoccaceae bacterium]